MSDAEPIRMVAKISKWAHAPEKRKRGGKGSASSGSREGKSDAKLLVEQAKSYGWLNGKRIVRRAKTA